MINLKILAKKKLGREYVEYCEKHGGINATEEIKISTNILKDLIKNKIEVEKKISDFDHWNLEIVKQLQLAINKLEVALAIFKNKL